jgi:hypothetical protein
MSIEKFEINPKLKKEINEEGWEKEDEESGAAVIIGKKEEMGRLRERLESEGKTKDLASYIRLHKEIFLPNSEIDDKLRQELLENKGSYDLKLTNKEEGEWKLDYIDKDGNIARVNIVASNIASFLEAKEKFEKKYEEINTEAPEQKQRDLEWLKRTVVNHLGNLIREELNKLNFSDRKPEGTSLNTMWTKIYSSIEEYKQKLEEESEESIETKKKEFVF